MRKIKENVENLELFMTDSKMIGNMLDSFVNSNKGLISYQDSMDFISSILIISSKMIEAESGEIDITYNKFSKKDRFYFDVNFVYSLELIGGIEYNNFEVDFEISDQDFVNSVKNSNYLIKESDSEKKKGMILKLYSDNILRTNPEMKDLSRHITSIILNMVLDEKLTPTSEVSMPVGEYAVSLKFETNILNINGLRKC